MLTTLSSPLVNYVNATTWYKLGTIGQRRFGNVGSRVVRDYTYEEGTQRLIRAKTDVELLTATQADVAYGYDPAGNVTRSADTPPAANAPSDTQCFRHDYLRRLTEAWTATDNCAGAPSLAVLGGAAPYWHSYTYDAVGNRKTEVQHVSTGDTTRTYTYPAAGQPRPHGLTSVTQQSPAGTATTSYGYDGSGNTITRPNQTLTWDGEGHPASVTAGSSTTSFLYDADGNRLIRRDPNFVTAYLGATELRLAKVSGLVTATHYYSDGEDTIAVRTYDSRLYWLVGDHNNTASMMIDAVNLAVTRRRFTPFGAPRGGTPLWKGERGFVDGTNDPTTGLTHLGAREYDPSIGRFISVDPVIDEDDPQQMQGYAYASNNPVTFTDPDGMLYNCGPDGFRCGMNPNYSRKGQYIGPPQAPSKPRASSPRRSSSPRPRVWHRQPDGGGYTPYRPRVQRPWHRQPDGGYDAVRETKFIPYRPPAPRPKPKPSLWQRAWKVTAQVTGIDAARRCIMEGSVSGCVETAITIVSYATVVGAGGRVALMAARHGAGVARTAARAYRPTVGPLERVKPPWTLTYPGKNGGVEQMEFGRSLTLDSLKQRYEAGEKYQQMLSSPLSPFPNVPPAIKTGITIAARIMGIIKPM